VDNGEGWVESVLKIIEDLKGSALRDAVIFAKPLLARFMTTPGAKKFQIEVENNVLHP